MRDSGIGIEPAYPAYIDHLFIPLFSTRDGGMGMDLSIFHSEAHGRRSGASSNDGPGAASQFPLLLRPENVA